MTNYKDTAQALLKQLRDNELRALAHINELDTLLFRQPAPRASMKWISERIEVMRRLINNFHADSQKVIEFMKLCEDIERNRNALDTHMAYDERFIRESAH